MSWMIAELVGGVSSLWVNMANDNRPKDTLPRTRYDSSKQSIFWEEMGGDGEQKGVRFPWIHNKGAVDDLDFQSLDISPSKNHVAVP